MVTIASNLNRPPNSANGGVAGAVGAMSIERIDPTPRRAVMFTPLETRIDVIVEVAQTAEQLGYDAVIVPEAWGLDSAVVLSTVAAGTERIRLVAGVMSIWGRTPATLAMTAATLAGVSGGRFTLGLGTSTPVLAEQLHGATYGAPATRLSRFIHDVRALLAGDRVSLGDGRRGLRLGLPAQPDVPIWVAGLGPRARAIARDHGDAWFPAVMPRDQLDPARRRLATGGPSSSIVACGPMAAVTSDSFDGSAAARQLVGWYVTGMGPYYGEHLAASGYAAEVEALRAANPQPRPWDIRWPEVADPLLEQLAVTGTPAEVSRQLAAWDALADLVTVGVSPAPLEAILATVHAAAPPTATGQRQVA